MVHRHRGTQGGGRRCRRARVWDQGPHCVRALSLSVSVTDYCRAPAKAPVVKKEPKAAAPIKKDATARRELEGQSGIQLGITVKKCQADFGEWYSQVLVKGEMLDYYDISGCYILKPASYGIWQEIQNWFDAGMYVSSLSPSIWSVA